VKMALPRGTSRLGEYPHLLDIVNIFLACGVLLCLAIPVTVPAGTVIIYLICLLSLLTSMIYCGIVIWELDTPSFHVCNLKLPVIVYGTALFMGIMHFITIWLCLSGIIDSGNAAFWVAIFLCIGSTTVQGVKFAAHFRQWQQDSREAGFDFPSSNYGSS
ncbi:hypothetical protein PFISCL1PPCAC_8162, partial [Pristionchus fissidentatus]